MKYVAGKHVYLLANLYHPAAYEWDWLNCYAIYKKRTQSFKRIEFFG